MRKVPCNYCKGQVLSTQNGRGTTSAPLFPRLQNFLSAIGDLVSALQGGSKTVSRKEALGGTCKACGGSGSIDDPTDTSKQDKSAADYLQSKSKRILELEQQLGNSPGGSSLERIAGAKITIVGRTLNDAKSYTVHKGKASHPSAGVTSSKGAAAVTTGPEKGKGTNVITGNNVPANTGGGLYYIQCGNKFKLTAGSQGIELNTTGPVSIDGGIVRFTGAEVTIGGREGATVVEGDHLQLNGQSIALTPSGADGHVVIQGSASTTGNFQAGGAYVENMYCSSLTMPSTQASTKASSGGTDLIGGPAKWGGMAGRAQQLAVRNLIKWVVDHTTDINMAMAMPPINPRSVLKTVDNVVNAVYLMFPLEPLPTGICITAVGPGIVYNFPHTHAEPDSPHTHEMVVPAISHDGNSSADIVRGKFAAAGGNSRIPAGPTESGNPLVKLVSGVVGGVKAVYNAGTSMISPYFT